MVTFIKVARTDELTPGQGKLVEVESKRIALFNAGGCYYALDDVCPHRGAPLSEGELEGATVICPWHGAIFDLATGNATRPPAATGVIAYEVRLDGEEITLAI
jgi:nitrite reductase/ring-hydroxylating ferredoxin subunit